MTSCVYKNICKFYEKNCVRQTCYRASYLNGMLDEKVKESIEKGNLEIIITKNDKKK